jgi:acetyl esterase/lipase
MKLPLNRRQVLLAGGVAGLASVARAVDSSEGIELWPGRTPGADHVTVKEELVDNAAGATPRDRVVAHVTRPLLSLFKPKTGFNGVTLLVVPGGGYHRVVLDREGYDTADMLTAQGFAAAVLRYRLPADGWAAGADAPVHDAMRAVRWLRAQNSLGGTAARVGAIGFSAGGHLLARLVTEPELRYSRHDALDDLSARADFAVLMYPVITTTGDTAHKGSAAQLVAAGVPESDLARYSAQLNVTADTPPTMLVHAADDTVVPVENSLVMFDALRKASVRSELHVFDRGGHGFGLRSIAGKDVAAWPMLVQNWALKSGDAKS